jgi:hypothetical protein
MVWFSSKLKGIHGILLFSLPFKVALQQEVFSRQCATGARVEGLSFARPTSGNIKILDGAIMACFLLQNCCPSRIRMGCRLSGESGTLKS